jgi:transposase
MPRKKYNEEFKTSAVKLAREGRRSGKNSDEVARDLGVHPNTLTEWIRRDDSLHAGSGKNTEGLSPANELEQLRKENRILKMEREILKKAATFFAKENS